MVYFDTDEWVAHCLETDLAMSSTSRAEAMLLVENLCEREIRTAALRGDLESVCNAAMPDLWCAFFTGRDVAPPHAQPQLVPDAIRFQFREATQAVTVRTMAEQIADDADPDEGE